MSKSGVALIVANSLLFMLAFIGFASADTDALFPVALFAMVMSVVNGVAVYRRRESEPVRRKRREPEVDEMDARTILDIDARLEALERREREMEEAERIRQMAAKGQQSAPPEPVAEAPHASPSRELA